MGERGPVPKPNPRRRNKRPNTGKHIDVARPSRPPDVAGEALKEWDRIVPELETMGLLARVDRGVLTRYCVLWADWIEVNANLQKTGKVLRGRAGGVVRSPLLMVRNELDEQLSELGKQLGLSPSARLRAGVVHDVPQPTGVDREVLASIDDYRTRLTAG